MWLIRADTDQTSAMWVTTHRLDGWHVRLANDWRTRCAARPLASPTFVAACDWRGRYALLPTALSGKRRAPPGQTPTSAWVLDTWWERVPRLSHSALPLGRWASSASQAFPA
jgi:hypothetical protein